MKAYRRVKAIAATACFGAAVLLGAPAISDEVSATTGVTGAVTKLPLPRYVSMKAHKANVRRGPSKSQRVDWIFLKINTPLEITAEYGRWRRVRDAEGAGGWVHYALLSGVRTALIQADKTVLRKAPQEDAAPVAVAEQGVIAKLGACVENWCEISVDGLEGWVKKSVIWGVAEGEIRE